MRDALIIVVIVDRWASHRYNHATQVWNKMSLQMFEYSSIVGKFASYWSPFRREMLRSLDIKFEADATPRIDDAPKPIVGYVDRQHTKRKFRPVVHAHLLDLFERLEEQGLMRFRHIVLVELSPEDQIRAVADLDVGRRGCTSFARHTDNQVMFGIHGNGLTHEIWMKRDSTLIEVSLDFCAFPILMSELRSGLSEKEIVAGLSIPRRSFGSSLCRFGMSEGS